MICQVKSFMQMLAQVFVHSQSPTVTQRSDICGKGAVGRGSESAVSQDRRNSHSKKAEGAPSGWLA